MSGCASQPINCEWRMTFQVVLRTLVTSKMLIHRDLSPEDSMHRAQGGDPTKEGTKPWVRGVPHRSPALRDGMSFTDLTSLA